MCEGNHMTTFEGALAIRLICRCTKLPQTSLGTSWNPSDERIRESTVGCKQIFHIFCTLIDVSYVSFGKRLEHELNATLNVNAPFELDYIGYFLHKQVTKSSRSVCY